jgi:hypothetical protein
MIASVVLYPTMQDSHHTTCNAAGHWSMGTSNVSTTEQGIETAEGGEHQTQSASWVDGYRQYSHVGPRLAQ